ncbi:MAG: ABC transporter substrate-binding protein, partial [Solirubrobacteraceae bacterium]
DTIAINPGANFTGEVKKIAESGAQGVFVSATATSEAARLFRELHASNPHLALLASSAMHNPVFTSNLGAAESVTTIGSPLLPSSSYPVSSHRVLTQYRRRFAAAPGPYVLYGYETMSVVLAAIRDAGTHGDDRQAVIEELLDTHDRHSVLGVYSIQPSGEATLSTYAIDRILHGASVFWRMFKVQV